MRCRNLRQTLFICTGHNRPDDCNPTPTPNNRRQSGQHAVGLIAEHRGMQVHQHHERARVGTFVVGAVRDAGRAVVRKAEDRPGMDDPGRRLVLIPDFETRDGFPPSLPPSQCRAALRADFSRTFGFL